MNGWLVYDEIGAKRNSWFIQKLGEELAVFGIKTTLKIAQKTDDFLDKKLPDFVIVRTICPEINRYFEEKNIPVFNNALTAEVACDKWETYLFCQGKGIATMPTKKVEEGQPFPCPFVVKSRDGHGGEEVFLINNQKEWEKIKNRQDKDRFIAQPLCDEIGKDMRVYVLGGKVLAAMLRTSMDDFRSNYSLGGKAEMTTPTKDQLSTIKKVVDNLSPDFIGIDFIRNQGEWILNEIEDAVGTRMLYAHTEIDAVKEFARRIATKLQGKVCL